MNLNLKSLYMVLLLIFFVFLPMVFFIFTQIPQRSILKDTISIITILAFFVVLLQFFLSNLNIGLKSIFQSSKIIKIHKILGYTAIPILLFHPFLIVVPRFFEVGPRPLDSFIKMITTFDSLAIILGIIGWCLILLLGLTSILKDKLKMSYKAWKIFHGSLALVFIIFASWHSIETGRHMNLSMSILVILISLAASILLFKSYFTTNKNKG